NPWWPSLPHGLRDAGSSTVTRAEGDNVTGQLMPYFLENDLYQNGTTHTGTLISKVKYSYVKHPHSAILLMLGSAKSTGQITIHYESENSCFLQQSRDSQCEAPTCASMRQAREVGLIQAHSL
ncbi:hypothetical protein RRG08_064091, partial [Elysia crispata]